MAATIKIDGLDKTLARFDIKKFEPQIQTCFDKFGLRVELLAKNKVEDKAHDRGGLHSSIHQESKKLASEITVSANYASFVEFGTRKYAAEYIATLPAEWQQLASSTKGGTSGSFEEFVLRLTEWVHRKGLGTGFAGKIGVTGTYSIKSRKRTGNADTQAKEDKQAAYLIARKILKDGLRARPFLYPAFAIAKDELIKQLNAIKL